MRFTKGAVTDDRQENPDFNELDFASESMSSMGQSKVYWPEVERDFFLTQPIGISEGY